MKATTKFLCALFLALSLPLAFSSCSNDDDNDGNKDKNSIVGTWKYSSLSAEITGPGANEAKPVIESTEAENYQDQTITFTSDGKYSAAQAGVEVGTGSYTYENGKVTMTVDGEDDTDTLNCTVNGNTMTMIWESDWNDYFDSYVITKVMLHINYTRW